MPPYGEPGVCSVYWACDVNAAYVTPNNIPAAGGWVDSWYPLGSLPAPHKDWIAEFVEIYFTASAAGLLYGVKATQRNGGGVSDTIYFNEANPLVPDCEYAFKTALVRSGSFALRYSVNANITWHMRILRGSKGY